MHHSTVDITPREVGRNGPNQHEFYQGDEVISEKPPSNKANSIIYKGQRRLRNVKSRTNSGMDLVSTTIFNCNPVPKKTKPRPSSATALSTVCVSYMSDGDETGDLSNGTTYVYARQQKARPASASAALTGEMWALLDVTQ